VEAPCDRRRLYGLRDQLRLWLEHNGVPDDLRDSLVLATHEALVQTIRLAVPCRELRMVAALSAHEITIEVSDTGEWSIAGSGVDLAGVGFTLIRSLVDEAEVVASNGTTVRLHQAFSRRPVPPIG
jgi:anti-sigma regulatory factor (Ser/Thr protein kinase)